MILPQNNELNTRPPEQLAFIGCSVAGITGLTIGFIIGLIIGVLL
jgi:hypothetical protein